MGSISVLFQFLIFVLNLALCVVGLTMMMYGFLKPPIPEPFTDLKDLFDDTKILQAVPTIIIVLGAIIFLVAFSGCWGALTSGSVLIIVYSGLLAIVVILELMTWAYIYFNEGDIKDAIGYRMKTYIIDDMEEPFHLVQIKLNCCGVDSYRDWLDSDFKKIPYSCCNNEDKSYVCGEGEVLDKPGCLEEAGDKLHGLFFKNKLFLASVLACQILAIISSIIVYFSLKSEDVSSSIVVTTMDVGLVAHVTSHNDEIHSDDEGIELEEYVKGNHS